MRSGIFALALIVSCANAETIRIRVVDGRNGKLIGNEHMQVWVDRRLGQALSLAAGPEGFAELEVAADSSIEVEANFYLDCRPYQKGAPRPWYPVEEIIRRGVVVSNSCGKIRSDAKAGELLFFVRTLRWFEGMRR